MRTSYVPSFCQTARDGGLGRGGSLARDLFSLLTCILTLLSLCCLWLYGSHPAHTRGREDLWVSDFRSSKSQTTGMLRSFYCFIPWCPNRLSLSHLEQLILRKMQQWRAMYKISKWSQFGSQEAHRLWPARMQALEHHRSPPLPW